ncbi:MAG: TIR domain-containing protein [Chloroflexota bacterium]
MDIKELIASADNAYYATEYDKAIELYKQALDLDPDNNHAQEQMPKAEFYRSFKGVKPEDLMAEALQLFKRSRSFIDIGDLEEAKSLLQKAISVAEKAGVDFTNAKAVLENLHNASKATEFKKRALDELDKQLWVRAEANLSLANDLDPTDHIVQVLLPHLRSLLKAQNLVEQLNSGFGSVRNLLKIDKEIQSILESTNETPILRNLWLQVLGARRPKSIQLVAAEKMKSHTPKIFISYSHKDESYKDEFVTMFAGLQRRGVINAWQDRFIEAGEEWFDAIRNAMDECNMAVLLISPDFIASSFIQQEELKRLFERRVKEGLRVLPIIIRPCLWQEEPVIKHLQALPKDGKPVISFSQTNGERDQVWADIGKKIKEIAENL